MSCQALVLVLLLYTVLGGNTNPAQELFPLGQEAGGLLNGKIWVLGLRLFLLGYPGGCGAERPVFCFGASVSEVLDNTDPFLRR